MEAVLTSEPDLMHHRAGSDPWALDSSLQGQETSRWPHRTFLPGILRCCARASCYSVRKLTLALKIQSGRKGRLQSRSSTVFVSFLISSLFFLTFFPAFSSPFYHYLYYYYCPFRVRDALDHPGIFICTTEQVSKHLAAIFKVLNQKWGLQNLVANNIF